MNNSKTNLGSPSPVAQLSEETIKELQRILKEEYGVEYTFAEASETASNLAGSV